MEYFIWSPMKSPWKISHVYFLIKIPCSMKPGPLFCRIAKFGMLYVVVYLTRVATHPCKSLKALEFNSGNFMA